MNLGTLKANLAKYPVKNVRFVLPSAELIPITCHVTEVGHVVKNSIDCGGSLRSAESCLLHAWISENDAAVRLATEKLSGILQTSAKVVPSDDLEVEVEYEACAVAQYRVDSAEFAGDELRFQFIHKHTDCLAREACGLPPAGPGCGCGDKKGKCC